MKFIIEAIDWWLHPEFDEKELDLLKDILTEKCGLFSNGKLLSNRGLKEKLKKTRVGDIINLYGELIPFRKSY